MNVSVRVTKAKPGTVNKIGDRISKDFLPRVSALPGFIGYYVVDIGGDRLVTISIFEDAQGTRSSIQLSQEWVRENIEESLAAPLEIMDGRVIAYIRK